ncbi:uncharacterized protein EKO05_0000440 [Ascochyta rabiei]|uniref:SigF-like NTF2-like domain-containing protein n=1 Tax=Didymella rabiei TaxID=5454 RepID=A0A163J772_DIDRA|nr:uncharacterized protein EKO05_0000440 [Ascochyta rabiei]KZM26189.1 hypothetical protein ST47_g2666 [Ascochyta rabiei]UPX09757.1 hypothetical protein EKO05_0000440 [Ascochyta rabiei]
MENPVKEIAGVIHLLTQSPPSTQRQTIETYFTPNASFTHPFCRTGKWPNSRWLIAAIYRWYKIMSPSIDITVQSVAFDESNSILYVSIFQIFRIWLIPFYYAPVFLTSVIKLEYNDDDEKYYIKSQDDLYAVDQWIRFIAPGGWILVHLWQFWATFFCVIGATVLHPITLLEERSNQEGSEVEWQRKRKQFGQLDGMRAEELLQRTELKGK